LIDERGVVRKTKRQKDTQAVYHYYTLSDNVCLWVCLG
jgi:hypothetical protein